MLLQAVWGGRRLRGLAAGWRSAWWCMCCTACTALRRRKSGTHTCVSFATLCHLLLCLTCFCGSTKSATHAVLLTKQTCCSWSTIEGVFWRAHGYLGSDHTSCCVRFVLVASSPLQRVETV